MLTASNQEKLQTLLQDRYLENKIKIPNDFGKLKTCPEIKKAFRKSLAEESNDSGEEKCTGTKWEKLLSHCSFAVSSICMQIINAILLQKKANLILGFINRCAIHDNWNKICQHCLLLMGFFIQKRDLLLDLLGKVQGIRFL